MLGFLQDDWNSIAATIDYATDLGSTFAQFKILTPYPGTPMFKQLEPLLTETDWEKFDGYTPTFKHPEPDRRASCGSCSAPPTRASTCGRRTWRTS